MIYKPATVTPVGQTAVLNTVAFVNGGDSRPAQPPVARPGVRGERHRRPLRRRRQPPQEQGQRLRRARTPATARATATRSASTPRPSCVNWLATDPDRHRRPRRPAARRLQLVREGGPDHAPRGRAASRTSSTSFVGPDAYSYVFDGQWGYLDHALGSASLVAQVTGVADYHINADEPSVLDYNTDFKTANLSDTLYAPDQFRISDHDPVVVGLNPAASTSPGSSARSTTCRPQLDEGRGSRPGEVLARWRPGPRHLRRAAIRSRSRSPARHRRRPTRSR